MKKVVFILIFGVFALSALPTLADTPAAVSVRIEGASACLFDGSVSCAAGDTVKTVLTNLDTTNDNIAISGMDGGYVSAVNGEAAGSFGGWDGWGYLVNGEAPSVGIADCPVAAGDQIVLYYGDYPTQIPIVDSSKIADGILTFTSKDTTWSDDGTPATAIDPIAGATVTWYAADGTKTYTTDDSGRVMIDQDALTPGSHRIQIEKGRTVAGHPDLLPTVLRLPASYTVTVPETTASDTSTTISTTTTDTTTTLNSQLSTLNIVQTGVETNLSVLGLAALGLAGLILTKKRK